MTSNSTEGNLFKSSSTSLDSYDLNTCYNKYLLYYKLPLLKEPQTIQSFYLHLDNHASYLKKLAIISLTKDKKEAHIYLPHDTVLLPNHTFPLSWDTYDISLKSYTNSTPTPIPIAEAANNNSISLSSTIEHTSLSIKIGSLNINDLLQSNKKLSLNEMLDVQAFDILGLSETHLSTQETRYFKTQNSNYTAFGVLFKNRIKLE